MSVTQLLSKARAFLSYHTSPKTLLTYAEYHVWRDQYFSLHKDHQAEAAEKLGRAFCQEHQIRDRELERSEQRINAEALIYARYVNRHRG